MTHNVIIIGSGPAGHTAALYSARANLSPVMFEGELVDRNSPVPGGQLMITTEVENYPGFPEGITGPELMDRFRKQSLRFDTDIRSKNITKVDFSTTPFKLWSGDDEFEAHTVIIATGAQAKWLGLESETNLVNKGVSACATCDGAFFKDKDVAVIGGGDTAIEEANFLTRHCSKVTVVHRRDELRASKIMRQRATDNPKIDFSWNSTVDEITAGDNGLVNGVKLKDTQSGNISTLDVQGVFVAIGHKPLTDIFEGQIDLDELGYIVPKGGIGVKTNIEGVFCAGDVSDKHYRQAITAAGTGCAAALEAERYLEAKGF